MGLTPRFVLASPDGAHLLVDWGASLDYRDASGKYLGGASKIAAYDPTAADDGFYVYGNEALWSGASSATAKASSGFTPNGAMLAFRADSTRRVTATQVSPALPHGGGGWSVQLFADRFGKPHRSSADLVAWGSVPGRGLAAIGPDWHTVVATQDGLLRVLSDAGDAEKNPVELVKTKLPYVATALSLAPPLVLAISEGATGTTLHALDANGVEAWSVPVAFGVRQPPVDGAGRALVVGSGIAAIEDGHVVWSQSSPVVIRATAFGDGSLALSVGSELRVVDRAGTIVQALRAGQDETLTTPPCILSDGTVWVASDKALYVAR